MNYYKKIIILVSCLFLFVGTVYAAKPLIGVIGTDNMSINAESISYLFNTHVLNIINSTGIFDMVNQELLNSELRKFDCLDENCFLRFANKANINLIITNEVEDKKDSIILSLKAYGTEIPFENKIIYKYKARIEKNGKFKIAELNFIAQEHAGFFIAKLLASYRIPVYLKGDNNTFTIDKKISGTFPLYRIDSKNNQKIKLYKNIGHVTVSNGVVTTTSSTYDLMEGDFILQSFNETADYLNKYTYHRKKEIVFNQPSVSDTFYKVMLTVPSSVVMPIAAPLFGYYHNSDWKGLSLWAFNYTPYLYLECKGLKNSPKSYKKEKRNISKNIVAQNHFAYYMLLIGGLPLFIDAFSHDYLNNASNYNGIQPLMGNSISAGYLALVSGGAGHFYRGYRSWGYFYFHLDTILLYLTIKEFSKPQKYCIATNSYIKGTINKKKAYMMAGIFSFVKIVEVVHAVLIEDNIRNGDVIEEKFTFEPIITPDDQYKMNFSLRYVYRF